MRKIFSLSLLVLLSLTFVTCQKSQEKVDEFTEFDIEYQSQITVPSQTMSLNVPVDFQTPDIPTNSGTTLASNKTTQSLVDYIKLTKFRISVGTGNLDFLKSLQIYVKASGVGEALVASKTPIPTGQTSVDADLQDVNIKNYIFQPNIQFRVSVVIDGSTLSGQTLILDNVVHVKATVIK